MGNDSGLSFDSVYTEHMVFVRRALARRGVRPADLDDVAQEAFVTVHRLLPTFEGRASLETWLHAVAWRVASGYHRKRRTERNTSDGIDVTEGVLSSIDLPGIERLHESLERLQPDDRDLFALYEVGGLSISELAELVGSSRATVSERLDRARRALGRSLSEPPSSPLTASSAEAPAGPTPTRKPARPLEHECPDCCFSTLGDTVVAVWRGDAKAARLEEVVEIMLALAELHPAGVMYFAVVEPTSGPPDRAGRDVMRRAAVQLRGKLRAFASANGSRGFAALIAPIHNAVVFLSRTRHNIRFFRDTSDAATWLASYSTLVTKQEILQRCTELTVRLDQLADR